VYQFFPDLLLHPKTESDVAHAIAFANTHDWPITARGGGTGTNGQSLNTGILLDLSTHMHQIRNLCPERHIAVVDPGVVLDQLNQSAAMYHLFFPPHVATSSRATIGGMVSTDASGKGSRVYGRTSDHIVALRGILANGDPVIFGTVNLPEFSEPAAIARGEALLKTMRPWIIETEKNSPHPLPALSRHFTGYNVTQVCGEVPSLIPLICGSEGTLCILTQIALKLQPIPEHHSLLLMHYPTMPTAMRDVERVLAYQPTAIESIDENTLQLGKQDSAYPPVADLFTDNGAVHLVAFSGEREATLATTQALATASMALGIATHMVTDPQKQAACWTLRKRAVGLLLRLPGKAKPVAFIEDSVVPPQHLAAYIDDLRKLLDKHGLFYAMYGHADVGCVHVRPALDLQRADDKHLFITLSDSVYALVKSYGGLLWGEHGKGLRGHYTADQIGPERHHLMRRIKTLFDPENRLNSGKLYLPLGIPDPRAPERNHLYPIDSPMKADRDRDISEAHQAAHAHLLACNGNGECFSINHADTMCPSFKATHNRVDSPKGRAGVLKEWLRAQTHPEEYPATFTEEIKDTLDRCLSCKGCTLTCPAQVDIPETRSLFLEQYYQTHKRPLRDYVFAMMEPLLPWMGRWPVLGNGVMASRLGKRLLSGLGISDAPCFGTRYRPPDRHPVTPPTVMVIPDLFSHCLDANIGDMAHAVLTALGEHVLTLPFIAHGKAQHVLGMRIWARHIAQRQYAQISAARARYGDIPIVVIEPGIVSMYRHEYPRLLACLRHAKRKRVKGLPPFGSRRGHTWLHRENPQNVTELPLFESLKIHGLGEFLATHHLDTPLWQDIARRIPPSPIHIIPHCMETEKESHSWVKLLQACGQTPTVKPSGCCGMAGLFGHQTEQKDLSQKIFNIAWKTTLHATAQPLVTGYSCRRQINRFATRSVQHPIAEIYAGICGGPR